MQHSHWHPEDPPDPPLGVVTGGGAGAEFAEVDNVNRTGQLLREFVHSTTTTKPFPLVFPLGALRQVTEV
jgi:hypothetical protein